MKKLIFVVLLCITSLSFANAQKNAVGFRFGGGAEFLYQRDLSTKNFLQFTLAIPNYEGLSLTGIYNWRCCQWDWTPRTCDWYLNAGVGGALGFYDFDDSGLLFGVAGVLSAANLKKCPFLSKSIIVRLLVRLSEDIAKVSLLPVFGISDWLWHFIFNGGSIFFKTFI